MLKPIPSENPEQIIKKTAKKARRFMASGPGVKAMPAACSLQRKWSEDVKKDRHVIKSACLRMVKFLEKNGRSTTSEIGEMIDGLRRSVLSLERERARIFNKENRKRRK